MRRDRRCTIPGWSTVQRVGDGGVIDSEQRATTSHRVVDVSEHGARWLGRAYWLEVERAAYGLLCVRERADGLDLRVRGRGPVLLRLGPAEVTFEPDRVVCAFPIRGGLLARRPGGVLALSESRGEPVELRAAVHGFFPRLGIRPGRPRWIGGLYDVAQVRAHVAISRRYFARLIAEASP
jgi:hypothetical protein